MSAIDVTPECDSVNSREQNPKPSSLRSFDPTPYVRQLRSRGGQTEYLDVKHRLLWLRTEHPDARIVTDLVRLDDQSAVFRASVDIPAGGSATGHGSETATDFSDYIEKAETKALGRALNALGFGAQFAENESDEPRSTRPSPDRARNAPPPKSASGGRGKSEDWTVFWEWARASGFTDQQAVEKVIGRAMAGLSTGELQKLLTPHVQQLAATA